MDSTMLREDAFVFVASHQVAENWYLSAWDLPRGKPWLQIVGIPAGIGLTLIGLTKLWRRLRLVREQVGEK
jgi:hypothetical protein